MMERSHKKLSEKVRKQCIIILTLISALLFCTFIIFSSASPLSTLGTNANTFNSLGMWSAIGMILACYLLPLLLYIFGIRLMKLLMGIFCMFGVIIPFFINIIIIIFYGKVINYTLLVIITVGIALIFTNAIWLFVAFMSCTPKD